MDPAAYTQFTRLVSERLEADARVLALIALGSMADPTLRDATSDHDFWLLVTPGSEASVLQSLDWLPRPAEHLAVVRFRGRGASVLYRDRHIVEFAVFTDTTLQWQPTDRYDVLIDCVRVEHRLQGLVAAAREQRASVEGWSDAIGNLSLVVWTGVQRYHRGEYLSSHKYLRYHAVDALLNAAQASGILAGPRLNFLDPWRRLEQIHPRLASEVRAAAEAPGLAGADMLLEVANTHLRPQLPDQNWKAVDKVHEWIRHPTAT
jgi:hypothetical protein